MELSKWLSGIMDKAEHSVFAYMNALPQGQDLRRAEALRLADWMDIKIDDVLNADPAVRLSIHM